MRIVAGIYGGRVLKSPKDNKTRPTSDRLRETVFNILSYQLTAESYFLDLCAGSGGIGIEALSRGAKRCVFVEVVRGMCRLIEENLDSLTVPEHQTEIICEKAGKFLTATQESFDIVYFDPPYSDDYLDVLSLFGDENSTRLRPQGVFIAEHSTKINLPDLVGELRRWRILKQGDSSLSFYERC